MRDDSGRQRAFISQEAELLAAQRTVIAHAPHADSLAGGHQFAAEHARIARIGALPPVLPDDFQLHIRLLPAQETDSAALLPAVPLLEIDPGAIPHIGHLAPMGRALAQRCNAEPLERPHVVLLAARGLLGDRQMGQRVRAQIQGKEMPGGILAAILRIARVVSGGGVKVAVARMDIEVS